MPHCTNIEVGNIFDKVSKDYYQNIVFIFGCFLNLFINEYQVIEMYCVKWQCRDTQNTRTGGKRYKHV